MVEFPRLDLSGIDFKFNKKVDLTPGFSLKDLGTEAVKAIGKEATKQVAKKEEQADFIRRKAAPIVIAAGIAVGAGIGAAVAQGVESQKGSSGVVQTLGRLVDQVGRSNIAQATFSRLNQAFRSGGVEFVGLTRTKIPLAMEVEVAGGGDGSLTIRGDRGVRGSLRGGQSAGCDCSNPQTERCKRLCGLI